MVNLVLGSFVIALTPVALGLAWNLVSEIAHWIAFEVSRAFKGTEAAGPMTGCHAQ